MRTNIRSRRCNRYHVDGEQAVWGHERYWGTFWNDGTHDPAKSAQIMADSVAYFALRSRRQIDQKYAAEDMARALADDARRQMAYRDLIVSNHLTQGEIK